jgi:hypothetical protein
VSSAAYCPFGQAASGTAAQDATVYATLDYDSAAQLNHALFRQLAPAAGRWVYPDPYLGYSGALEGSSSEFN